MSDLKELTQEALALPLEERVALAESLLLTVPESEPVWVDPAVMEVAERRLRELESGQVRGIPAEEVLSRARAAIRCSR